MKPVAVAIALSIAAAWMGLFAVVREVRRGEESKQRFAALDADMASLRERAPEVVVLPPTDSGLPIVAPGPSHAETLPEAKDDRLSKLEADVRRLEETVRELNRAARVSIEEEITGLSAEKLWDKSQMAIRDHLSGRSDALLRAFLERFPNDPRVPEALLSLANSEMRLGDMPEAREFYDRILRDFPASPQAPYAEFYVGMSLADAGDLAGATTHYEKSIEGLAGNAYWQAAALYNLGDAYRKKGQPEVAKEYFRKVNAQFGTNAEAKQIVDLAGNELKSLEGN